MAKHHNSKNGLQNLFTRIPAGNSGFALWRLTCFLETSVQDSAFELRMNSRAENSPQRKAAKR